MYFQDVRTLISAADSADHASALALTSQGVYIESAVLISDAGLAQLVERYLAKVQVDGSNPLARSISPFLVCPGRA